MIISTGAAELSEIHSALTWIQTARGENGLEDIALMQCISSYPTPMPSSHLAAITSLHEHFGIPVGYSDHTTDERTGGLAVAAGATLLEKHITCDRAASGPDQAASLDPDQFCRYVRFARMAAEMLGSSEKTAHAIEHDVRRVARQSVVAARSLQVGHVIARGDLTVKRPGGGIEPERIHELVGQVVRTAVRANEPLRHEHVNLPARLSSHDAAPAPRAEAA
jgi:sialic acid synthase SpsE